SLRPGWRCPPVGCACRNDSAVAIVLRSSVRLFRSLQEVASVRTGAYDRVRCRPIPTDRTSRGAPRPLTRSVVMRIRSAGPAGAAALALALALAACGDG